MNTDVYEPERFRSAEYLAAIDEHPSAAHFRIPSGCIQAITAQAEAGYPLEICGLLVGKMTADGWDVRQAIQVTNLNNERAADRFQLDPAGYQAVDKELRGSDLEIIGVYHSHPDCPAKPSPTDLENAWEGFSYPIISICDGKAADFRCWGLNSSGTAFQDINVIEASS